MTNPDLAAKTAPSLAAIGADGYVSAEDILFLRRNVFRDGVVSPAELDALFALAERAPKGDPEWAMFFEEAAADFYLREEAPEGYLTEDEFASLKARVIRGAHPSPLKLGLLLKLLETATATPPAMAVFVADQLRAAILRKGARRGVTRNDVDLLQRFIFAKGGAGGLAVTRVEAELLFDINDANATAANDPAWTTFFVKSIANHLMAHFSYAPPSREEARARHAFMSDHKADIGGVFKRMARGGLGLAKRALAEAGREEEKSAQAQRNEQRDRAAAIAEKVTPVEADWLADRIGRDGDLHDSERALIDYMKQLGAELPPKLKALADKAA
ncbi:MAG: hypothetical protein AB7P23_03410 [Amphiplicatus sp.]